MNDFQLMHSQVTGVDTVATVLGYIKNTSAVWLNEMTLQVVCTLMSVRLCGYSGQKVPFEEGDR